MSLSKRFVKPGQITRRAWQTGRLQRTRGRSVRVERLEQRLLLTGAAGDFNGDGYDDLAVGVPLEDVPFGDGEITDAGAVNVIYGSENGLTAAGNQLFHQNSPNMHGAAGSHDRFGFALAAGDFNADGFSDLAVGIPYEDVGGAIDAGAVQVIYGSPLGLIPAGVPGRIPDPGIPENQLWYQDVITYQADMADKDSLSEAGDRFGFALAVGDFDGDGDDDLAIGAPGESVGGNTFAGAVTVLYGSPESGLVGSGAQHWHQDTAGIKDEANSGDNFGFSLAAGRFNDDIRDDLAIGVPFEDVSETANDDTPVDGTDSGAVHVLYGSNSGLTAAGDQLITQFDLGGSLDDGDAFGYSLAAGNFNFGNDGLAIGVPYEDNHDQRDSGEIYVVFGSAEGLDLAAIQTIEPPVAQQGSLFGYSLAAGDFGVSFTDDLAIGAPWTIWEGVPGAGAVYVAYGSLQGLAVSEDVLVQGYRGISGTTEPDDLFGYSLVTGDFGLGTYADLAVGVPLENVGDSLDGGAVHVFYAAGDGLAGGSNELWHQGIEGIEGGVEPGDSFGCGLAGGSLGKGTASCLRTIPDELPDLPSSPSVANDPQPDPLTDAEIANIQKYISHELDGNIAGYQIAIAQDGVLLHELSVGKARLDSDPNDDVDDSIDMTNDLRLGIASVSKMITAITVLKLADGLDHPIDLNAPFTSYLNPDLFPPSEIDATVAQITVLELLTQTSGLEQRGLNSWPEDNFWDEARDIVGRPRKMHNCFDFATSNSPAPPSRCLREYNNWNFVLLRFVIEGVAWPEGASYDDWEENAEDYAAIYVGIVLDAWLRDVDPNDEAPALCIAAPPMSYYDVTVEEDGDRVLHEVRQEGEPIAKCGAGAWRASAEDLIDILRGIRHGAILSPAMNDLLLDITLADASLAPSSTALAWEAPWPRSSPENLGKNGGIEGMRAYITRLPDNVDAVLLTNTNGVPIDPTVETTSPTTVLRDAYDNKDPEAMVQGTAGDDVIVVRLNADEPDFVEVTLGGKVELKRLACTVETISIFTQGGNDQITIESLTPGIHIVLNGSEGDDGIRLDSLPSGNDAVIHGAGGNDTVDIGGGHLDSIRGKILVDGGASTDVVVLNDAREIAGNLYGFSGNVFNKGFHNFSIRLASVAELRLDAGSGNDSIDVASLIDLTPLVVRGNDGDDFIDITIDQPIQAEGGNGDDTLSGGLGDDTLDGGSGNDSILGNYGNDSLIGGNDNDTMRGGVGNDTVAGGFGRDLLFGDEDHDSLYGDDEEDVINGGGGNDNAFGGAGIDLIDGGPGNDTLMGDSGDDVIHGNENDDYVYGGTGNDSLYGGAGNDSLFGEDQDDTISGEDGEDQAWGGDGNDSIDGGMHADTIRGEKGNDTIVGGDGDDSLSGDEGDEGDDESADLLYGGLGNDTLEGGRGRDVLYGEDGDDHLIGGVHVANLSPEYADYSGDTLDGGSGNDAILGDDGEFFLLLFSDEFGGGDLIRGGTGNDTIFAQGGDDEVYGNNGDDSIAGGTGNDSLYGQVGDDVLLGGADHDTLLGGIGDDSISGGDGNDVLFGELGDDQLVGNAGADTVFAGLGDDTLVGGNFVANPDSAPESDNDLLDAGPGFDWLFGDSAFLPLVLSVSAGGNDTLLGGADADALYGQSGADSLNGGDGDDTLLGGEGDDLIRGGLGNDQLGGGAGNDILLGEDGADSLIGFLGRDLLIGGGGADDLDGGADDDILIAGTTAHDANDAALNQILAEWTSPRTYKSRVNNLKGKKNSEFRNRLNGSVYLKTHVKDATVFKDFASDGLTGSTGTDWFLYDPALDLLADLMAGELKN